MLSGCGSPKSRKCCNRYTRAHCLHLPQVRRYMPYGSGSRECLGMPQARVTMLATLAVMLSRFSFRLAAKVSCLAFGCLTSQ